MADGIGNAHDIEGDLWVARATARQVKSQFAQLDLEDLEQEAAVAVLKAAQTWSPEKSAAFSTYAWRACRINLWRHAARECAPVSASQHRLGDLFDTTRVQYDEEEERRETAWNREGVVLGNTRVSDTQETMDMAVKLPALLLDKARTFERLRSVIAACPDGAAAMEALLGGETQREVAARRGSSLSSVRRSVARAKEAIADDATLREMVGAALER